MNKIRKIALYAGCLLLVIVLLHYSILSLRSFSDFGPYYQAGERFIEGQNLYDFSDGHYLFKYAPLAALFFTPLSLLPYSLAAALWLGFSWLLLALSYLLAAKLEWGEERRPVWAVLLAFLGISKFALAEIHLGQVDFLLLFFVLVAVKSLGKKWEVFGGSILAVAVLFKPPLLLVFILALWRRRGRFQWGFLSAILAGLCAPVLRYGLTGTIDLYRGWWSVLSNSSPGLLASEVNQSIFGALTRWLVTNPQGGTLLTLSPGLPLIIGTVTLACFLLYLWHLDKKARHDSDLGSPAPAMLLLGSVIFSPLGWVQNYVLALPALIRALYFAVGERPHRQWRIAFLALFFLMAVLPNFELLGRRLYNIYLGQSWIFMGVVCLAAANLLTVRERNDHR